MAYLVAPGAAEALTLMVLRVAAGLGWQPGYPARWTVDGVRKGSPKKGEAPAKYAPGLLVVSRQVGGLGDQRDTDSNLVRRAPERQLSFGKLRG